MPPEITGKVRLRQKNRRDFILRIKRALLGLPQEPKKRTFSYWIRRIIISLLLIYIIIVFLMTLFQRSFIYFPERLPVDRPLRLPEGSREVSLMVKGIGRICGVYHPAEKDELMVLLLHGNAKNLLHYMDLYNGLVRLKVGVLMIDYPGFGKSGGTPTEKSVYESAEAALRWLVKERNIPPSKIVLFGKSLGTAVATYLATRNDCAGLILESPFKSIVSVGQSQYPFLPVRLLIRDRYEILSRVRSVVEPLLVIVAEEDTLVEPEESYAVYEAANEPKSLLTIRGAEHNDIQAIGGEFYWNALNSWLLSISSKESPGKPQ